MGAALATAALTAGFDVTIVSGPVSGSFNGTIGDTVGVRYPPAAEVIPVVTTEEMLAASLKALPKCCGVIAAAAPCDFKVAVPSLQKLSKSDLKNHSNTLCVEFVETVDIVATLVRHKTNQWFLGFALETHDHHRRAVEKLRRKGCDWIALNSPKTLDSDNVELEILDKSGTTGIHLAGTKIEVATQLFRCVIPKMDRFPLPSGGSHESFSD